MTSDEKSGKDCCVDMKGDTQEKEGEVVTKQPLKSEEDLEDESLDDSKDGPVSWCCATCMVCFSDMLECILNIFMCCVFCEKESCINCLAGVCRNCLDPCGLFMQH